MSVDYFELMQDITAAWCERHGIPSERKPTQEARDQLAKAERDLYGYEAGRIDAKMREILEKRNNK